MRTILNEQRSLNDQQQIQKILNELQFLSYRKPMEMILNSLSPVDPGIIFARREQRRFALGRHVNGEYPAVAIAKVHRQGRAERASVCGSRVIGSTEVEKYLEESRSRGSREVHPQVVAQERFQREARARARTFKARAIKSESPGSSASGKIY